MRLEENMMRLEFWSFGVLEFWSFGILEYWSFGVSEDIFLFHRKHFLATRRFFVIGRNFLSQEEISCHRKKFLVTVGSFLSQELGGNSVSQQVIFHVDKHLFLEEISCTEGNIL